MGLMLGRDRLGKGTDTDCVDPLQLGRHFERHNKFISLATSMRLGDVIEPYGIRQTLQQQPCRSKDDLDMRHNISKDAKIQKNAKNPLFKSSS